MKILVGCEKSGIVRDAFIAKGHDAISCDFEPTERPGPHIQGDVTRYLQYLWDMAIIHPPCTRLTMLNVTYHLQDKVPEWEKEYLEALAFFHLCLNANAPRVAVEYILSCDGCARVLGI